MLLPATCQSLSVAANSGQGTHTRQALIYQILTHAPSYSSIRIASGQDEAKETGVEEGALIPTTVSALVYLQTRRVGPGLRQRLFWDREILNLALTPST